MKERRMGKESEREITEKLQLLNSEEPFAVLATSGEDGPYASLVAFALLDDKRRIVIATPRGSRKYRNLLRKERVALLIDRRSRPGESIMKGEALTITGRALPVRKSKIWESLATCFLHKHPYLKEFLKKPTTALVTIEPLQAVHVGKFQEVSTCHFQ